MFSDAQEQNHLSKLFEKNTIRKKKPPEQSAPEATPAPTPPPTAFTRAKEELNSGLRSLLDLNRKPTPPTTPLPPENVARLSGLLSFRSDVVRRQRPLLPLGIDGEQDDEPDQLPPTAPETAALPPSVSTTPEAPQPISTTKGTPTDSWVPYRPENAGNLSYNDLYYKYRKLQLHYSVCQILLKVGLARNALLQEIVSLLGDKFSLWQCHIFLIDDDSREQLSCVASYSRKHMEYQHPDWSAVKVNGQTPQAQVIRERRDILTGHEMYNHYSVPLAHQQEIRGVIDMYYAPSHVLTVEEQLTVKTVAAQISSYLEEHQKYQSAQQLATTDGLTGVHNHRYFQERFEAELKQAHLKRQTLSLILLDIDHFKQINDTHGHLQGDKVLLQVAQVIRKMARTNDMVARYGGEEFAILLSNTAVPVAQEIAERIRAEIAHTEIVGDFKTPLKVTASLGVTGLQTPGIHEREHMIVTADQALYRAKTNGRNQVQVQLREVPETSPSQTTPVAAPIAAAPTLKWADFLRRHEEAIKHEWSQQTDAYAVPEVTHAVWRMKPVLSNLLNLLADHLEGRLNLKDKELEDSVELLPARLIREIREGSAELSLISFEMAVVLLQDACKDVIRSDHFSESDQRLLFAAVDLLVERLNQSLKQLFKRPKT